MQQDKPVTIDVFFAANGRVFFPFIVLSFLQSVCLKRRRIFFRKCCFAYEAGGAIEILEYSFKESVRLKIQLIATSK